MSIDKSIRGVIRITGINKSLADQIADRIGLERRELSSRGFGWNGTCLYYNDTRCGDITVNRTNDPLALEVDIEYITPAMAEELLAIVIQMRSDETVQAP